MALEVRREARGSSARDDDAEAVRRAPNGARAMKETTTETQTIYSMNYGARAGRRRRARRRRRRARARRRRNRARRRGRPA